MAQHKERLLITWGAVFLLVLVAGFGIYRYYHPVSKGGERVTAILYNGGRIDEKIWHRADFGLPEIKRGEEIVKHYAYTLSYNEADEEARWVAYTLTRDHLDGTEKRASRFEADPDVETGSAEPGDYRKSGYDKGHLAPAADMKWNREAMQESFYLSNVCPQNHSFNDGIWASLEKAVRAWSANDSVEYIVTGPVPGEDEPVIGKNHVKVPSYFYKVVLCPAPNARAVGFIIPNQPCHESFWKYACTVTEVEKQTHIRFFPSLPENIAQQVKNQYNPADWKSGGRFGAGE